MSRLWYTHGLTCESWSVFCFGRICKRYMYTYMSFQEMPALLKIGEKLCAGCKSYFSCLECAWQRMMWYGGGGGWPWSPSLPLSHRYKLPTPSPSPKKVSIFTGGRLRQIWGQMRWSLSCWGWGCDRLKTILSFPSTLTPEHSPNTGQHTLEKLRLRCAYMSRVRHSLYEHLFLSCSSM